LLSERPDRRRCGPITAASTVRKSVVTARSRLS
jgi:hypothetical protein